MWTDFNMTAQNMITGLPVKNCLVSSKSSNDEIYIEKKKKNV